MSDLHFIDPHPLVSRCVRKLFWLNKLICYTCASLYRLYALCFCHLALEVFVMVDKSKKFWNRKRSFGAGLPNILRSDPLGFAPPLQLSGPLANKSQDNFLQESLLYMQARYMYGHWPLVTLIGWLRLPEKENTWPTSMQNPCEKLQGPLTYFCMPCYGPGWAHWGGPLRCRQRPGTCVRLSGRLL